MPCPHYHLMVYQLSVLFYRRSARLPCFELDLLKVTTQLMP